MINEIKRINIGLVLDNIIIMVWCRQPVKRFIKVPNVGSCGSIFKCKNRRKSINLARKK